MPSLSVQLPGRQFAGAIGRRVTIGRWPTNGIVIADPSVSRIHAWICPDADGFQLIDGGSRTGTLLNGQRLGQTARLADGDQIRIGPAMLTFHAASAPPASGAAAFSDDRSACRIGADGIKFECACGAPVWAPAKLAGSAGVCRHCRGPLRVPQLTPAAPGADAVVIGTCSVCNWPIHAGEPTTQCPSCQLLFHAECWHDNAGCSAYGCPQVGALADAPAPPPQLDPEPHESPPQPHHGPWEYTLLAASVFGALAGLLSFGAPALLALVFGLLLRRRRGLPERPGIYYLCLGIAAAGLLAGVPVSYLWWIAS